MSNEPTAIGDLVQRLHSRRMHTDADDPYLFHPIPTLRGPRVPNTAPRPALQLFDLAPSALAARQSQLRQLPTTSTRPRARPWMFAAAVAIGVIVALGMRSKPDDHATLVPTTATTTATTVAASAPPDPIAPVIAPGFAAAGSAAAIVAPSAPPVASAPSTATLVVAEPPIADAVAESTPASTVSDASAAPAITRKHRHHHATAKHAAAHVRLAAASPGASASASASVPVPVQPEAVHRAAAARPPAGPRSQADDSENPLH